MYCVISLSFTFLVKFVFFSSTMFSVEEYFLTYLLVHLVEYH
jgi:hypothetical protein